MSEPAPASPSGLPHALAAYVMWGLVPLYMLPIREVAPWEVVGWRILFTVPFCLVLIYFARQGSQLALILRNRKALLALTASALLIGGNWLIYFIAIQEGHVLAASLGYYINPLANVLAGALFLGERLSRRAWLAVVLAAAGVAMLAWGARETLLISLSLAGTFCGYGLVRKLAPVPSLPGLAVESALLVLPALAILGWLDAQEGLSFGDDSVMTLMLIGSGIVLSTPLLFFAVAARRMDYSSLGFVQFLSPTLGFFLALFVFHEPLRPVQLACFVLIWVAIALFSWDLMQQRIRVRARP